MRNYEVEALNYGAVAITKLMSNDIQYKALQHLWDDFEFNNKVDLWYEEIMDDMYVCWSCWDIRDNDIMLELYEETK